MRLSTCVTALAVALGVSAAGHSGRSLKHVGLEDKIRPQARKQSLPKSSFNRRDTSQYLTNSTQKYSVNGTAIPEVDFDIGESYAGLMPISKAANESRQLYFWFFPSENTEASDEILIWLNGGPGCSSLEGLLQENGPFTWQYGTYKPVPNPYTWVNLTNVVWVEQPVGTGFSQGVPTATSEADVAAQFLGFWENFVNTFALQGRKVYITGESYAGFYVPYIADAMLNKNDTTYHNLEGTMIYDPSTSTDVVQRQLPAMDFINYWDGLHPFNDSFRAVLQNMTDSCGYTEFNEKYFTFPPPGPLPVKLPGTDEENVTTPDCDIFDLIYNEIFYVNPCWDIYQVATTCPVLWDVLGFPGSFDYLPAGASIYFNRTDVQKAINAPLIEWAECTNTDVFINNTDTSLPSGLSVLPGVIERSKRTIIGHGDLDFVLISNGTLLMIQNMTWNGAQGFQSKPSDPFYVPYHDDPSLSTLAASGVLGTTHTERGLTWVSVDLSGHMIPQYAPSAAYRHLEFLLGRVESLSSMSPFTTQPFPQPNVTAGNGTAPPVKRFAGMEGMAVL
ncbi:alpha/beta-Hydrolase [Glarea lozoyensis ATCC 20868]|uniref:Carboxypeptidase n=1 Tax=Glarea lozoyensis (strain ATCC 20868 / MF5171) TaxID=1116229 RepID=S3D9C6_GLAL2|nr:alpha/beta-Hydrolase [Glarea lozoyensis ATCC 20868]EPE28601.1 alpha/beta-Hydrolase [Glarea lozoyensis ATCC 20868]